MQLEQLKTSAEVRVFIDALRSQNQATEDAARKATHETYKEIRRLQTVLEALEAPFNKKYNEVNKELSKAEEKRKLLLAEENAAKWKNAVPNPAMPGEINSWYGFSEITAEIRERSYCSNLDYFSLMKRQPANLNKTLTIVGLKSHDARIYFAFKNGKLVDWMHIQNARHRGAMCDITSNCKANLYTKPLETWLNLIGAQKEVM